MSVPAASRDRPSELVAGFLAAASIAASLVGIVQRPIPTTAFALVVALVALVMSGERYARLAAFAVATAGVAFVLGMTVAIATDGDLW